MDIDVNDAINTIDGVESGFSQIREQYKKRSVSKKEIPWGEENNIYHEDVTCKKIHLNDKVPQRKKNTESYQ